MIASDLREVRVAVYMTDAYEYATMQMTAVTPAS